MRTHYKRTTIAFPATLLKVTDQFFARIQLSSRWLITIEIANKTNPESNIVQVVAMHMATIDLTPPSVANFDLAIPRRGPVSDDKMIRKSVPHSTNLAMIIIKRARVPLTRTAVVNNDEFPTTLLDRRPPNRVNGCDC